MAIEVKLPDLGEGVDSAEVINVMVEVGDSIQAEQSILEIETDKASVEVPSSDAGKVSKIHVDVGDTVSTGETILTLEAASGSDTDKEESTDEPESKDRQAPAETPEQPEQESKGEAEDEEAAPDEAEQDEAETEASAESKPQREQAELEAEPEETDANKQPPTDKAGASATMPSVSTADTDIAASPRVRKLARQLGVDLRRVKGTSGGGRITEDDLYAAVRDHNIGDGLSGEPTALQSTEQPAKADQAEGQDADAWGPIRRERISKVRATIARKMHESWTTIPHVTHFDEADITELDEFRQERKGDLGKDVKLTLMPFVVRAVAEALKQHSKVNASLDLDGGEIIYHDYVSIGIAVDTDRGLVVPVLRHVAGKGIAQLAKEINDLAARTRDGDFSVEDLRGGTFTISNQGAVGGAYATPIINYPESAILLLGRGGPQPRVHDGEIEQRLIMPLSFSYDHRLIDGANAGRFVNTLKDLLQYPGKLLLSL
ncbi:MAG: 2-oxo acid dehydrogenase subunit E2 [Phycisphaerae bacterium]|nr:2-oxo acid dehydrogenase subunit E2 [Phycisphaerae bacterium]